ncbi:head decoration protein [Pannonibacter sp.]|uniref:head decoration protein n=1 Tax=Pannonibacter sp. TaxID=1906786 RepID=UPI003F6F0995
MTTLTEGRHPGSFLVWEALRDYTRETVTLASGAGKLDPGTVLGKITSGGKFTQLAPAASNGSQTAAAILWGAADASAADAPAVVVLRGPAIVNRNELVWPTGATEPQITAATAALTALGILLR